jgi:hypothetical protein
LERLANSAKVDRDTISKHVSTHLADAGAMAQDVFEAFSPSGRERSLTRLPQPPATPSTIWT